MVILVGKTTITIARPHFPGWVEEKVKEKAHILSFDNDKFPLEDSHLFRKWRNRFMRLLLPTFSVFGVIFISLGRKDN